MLQGFEKFKKYGNYLEEISKRLGKIGIFLLVGTILGVVFSSNIILFFLKIFNFSGVNVVMTSPSQLIDLSLLTGIIVGVILTIPYLGYHTFAFAGNALSKKEKQLLKTFLPLSLVLFVLGCVFGGGVTQWVIALYSKFSSGFAVNNIWDIQKFFNQVIITALLTGLIFQMPIVLTAMMRFGLVKRSFLVSKRKYVYVAIIITTVLLPTTDILSLIFEALPLLFLFEIALLLNRSY